MLKSEFIWIFLPEKIATEKMVVIGLCSMSLISYVSIPGLQQ